MISSLRSSISFWRRSTGGSNPDVLGGVPPRWHPEVRKALAKRPAQGMVARKEVTTRPCCHDSCDEVNPARTRFTQHVDNVWGANSRRTSLRWSAVTIETKRNK